jgi:hypothetical protein
MKNIWLWLLLVISVAGQSQNFTSIEYFFDDDPGIGNGTTISVSPSDSLIVSTTIPTTSLSTGFHKLYFRAILAGGTWSLYEGRTFYIQEDPADLSGQLIEAEYFYDTDPGLGNGLILPATTGDSLLVDTSVPTTALDPGFHKLYVRAKNEYGIWSLYEGRTIYIQPPVDPIEPLMTYAEYFYDVDPGLGNGSALAVTPDDSLLIDTTVPTTGLSEGFHKLFVRAKNDNEIWSLYEGRTLFIQQLPNPDTLQLVAAEYYFDTEPGIGMGASLNVIAGDSIDASFSVIQSLPVGVHTMFLRVQASNGEWSLFEARTFDIGVGVEDLSGEELASMRSYPNPFADITQLEINLNRAEDVRIEILDVSGKLVRLIPLKMLNSGTHKIMLNSDNLAEGSYCCHLITPTFSKTCQLLVVR